MKRIILLSFDYPPNNGGIARLCHEIVKELKRRELPYHVVTNVASDSDDENVTRITGRRGEVEYKILKFLKKHTSSEDLILCDTWHPAGSLAKISGRKYFILAHGAEYLPGASFFRKKIYPIYRRSVLRGAECIIANSHYTAGLVESHSPRLNVCAIPLAIDADTFFPSKNKKADDDILRICSISRLEKFKGHDFILTTVAHLPENYKNKIRIEIGGKGPYKDVLESLSKKLGLQEQVCFLGYVPEDGMNDFYSRNDLFILCTREEQDNCNVEGFGLVFVEAQACGTAVVGTRAGGIPDAIHEGRGGWLIDQDSETELSGLLKQFVDAKHIVQKEGHAARERVIDECSQKHYADALLKMIYGQC